MPDDSMPLEAPTEQPPRGVAQETRPPERASDSYVLFAAGGVELAAPLDNVREVRRLPQITWLPRTPAWLRGVATLEGEIISVVDLAALMGAPKTRVGASRSLFVAQSRKEPLATGLIVDAVRGVGRLPRGSTRPHAPTLTGEFVAFLGEATVLNERLVTVLRCDELMSSAPFRQFDCSAPIVAPA